MAYVQKGVNGAVVSGTRIDNISTDAGSAGGSGTGLKYSNDGHIFFVIVNSGVGTPNVIIEGNGSQKGVVTPDVTIALAANSVYYTKPFDPSLYNDSDGFLRFNFTGGDETDVRIHAFRAGTP